MIVIVFLTKSTCKYINGAVLTHIAIINASYNNTPEPVARVGLLYICQYAITYVVLSGMFKYKRKDKHLSFVLNIIDTESTNAIPNPGMIFDISALV